MLACVFLTFHLPSRASNTTYRSTANMPMTKKLATFLILFVLSTPVFIVAQVDAVGGFCNASLLEVCAPCLLDGQDQEGKQYDCSHPGLESFTPGQYEGVTGK